MATRESRKRASRMAASMEKLADLRKNKGAGALDVRAAATGAAATALPRAIAPAPWAPRCAYLTLPTAAGRR